VAVRRVFEAGGTWLSAMMAYTNEVAPSSYVLTVDEDQMKAEAEELSGEADLAKSKTISQFIKSFQNRPLDDPVQDDHREIMISNHQIYADWLYLWGFLDQIHRAASIKIIMKKELGDIPVVGFAMSQLGFMFLHRDWAKDADSFTRDLKKITERGLPYNLLIFPEGTTLWAKGKEKSREFSRSNGYPEMEHVLCPRVKGLYAAVLALKDNGAGISADGLQGILDLTIGYSDVGAENIPAKVYTLRSIFSGSRSPREIHINAAYIPLGEIPTETEEAFGRWLALRFARKDKLLDHFYRNKQFTGKIQLKRTIASKKHYAYLTVHLLALHIFLYILYALLSPFLL
jgi:1-acyl-sn-glycerol-3-phosphate acyltransferase